jgi:hypothetical protein
MKGRFSPAVCVLRGQLNESFSALLFVSLRLCVKLSYNAFMRLQKSVGILLLLLLVVPVSAKIQKMQHIPSGLWGGQHISIDVGSKSATIEYDCANGVINGPLVVDADGRFNLRGTHRMEHGGPIREGDNPPGHPATYTGTIKGNTMTLTLKVGDSEEETFTLEKGKPGELVKCK